MNGIRISIYALNLLEVALREFILRVRRQRVHAVEVQEMLVFNDGFRIFLFLKEGFRPLHHDGWVGVLFYGVGAENLQIGTL